MSDADEAAVEAWLDSHPAFFEDYFQRRGSRGLVDGWLRRRLAGASATPSTGGIVGHLAPRSFSCSVVVSSSGGGSGSSGGGAALTGRRSRRIRKASSELAEAWPDQELRQQQQQRRRLPALTEEAASAREMMLSSLLMELDSRRLHRRIVRACRLLLLEGSDRCALFLAEQPGWLRLVEDTATDSAQTSGVRVPLGVGIVGSAAATGQTLRLAKASLDPRFNAATDELPDCAAVSILAAPLKDPNGEVIGLLLASGGSGCAGFTDAHEKSLQSFLAFCSASLRNSTLFQQSLLEAKRNEVLLDLVRITFEHTEKLDLLAHNILHYMCLITRCTWCQILLIDDPSSAEGSFDRVFELRTEETEGADKSADTGRLLISGEIVQQVICCGAPVIIADAAGDPRLTPEEQSRIQSLLCLPVRNSRSEPSGLCLLMNPADGRAFSESDAILAEAFALFCGLGIHSVRQRERAETEQRRQRVALEVLGYHASAGPDEARRLARSLVPSARYFGIDQLGFDEFSLSDSDTLLCGIKLFQEAGLLSAFQLDYRVFCRWLLSVKKNYRPVAYHNWRHAFSAAHCAHYLIKKSPELSSHLSKLEQLAVLIAALCHDLDHRDLSSLDCPPGLSPLANMYSSSLLESQHFSQCIMLLSLEGCDILSRLPQSQYSRCIGVVEKCILATDLRRHFESRLELQQLMRSHQQGLDWSSQRQRDQVLGLIMTCADLCAAAKPWPQQRRVAQLVSDEFQRLNNSVDTMTGLKQDDAIESGASRNGLLPALQLYFIDSVCLPAFELLSSLCSNLDELRQGCLNNRAEWETLAAEGTGC